MKIVKGIGLSKIEYLTLRTLIGRLSTDIVLDLGLSRDDDTVLGKLYGEMSDLEEEYLEERWKP